MEFFRNPFAVNRSTVRVITIGNVVVPLLFVLYMLFVLITMSAASHVIVTSPYFIGLCIAVVWLLFALRELTIFPRSSFSVRTTYTLYHTLVIGVLLAITGFSSPLSYAWIFLMVVTYTYFGTHGLLISIGLVPLLAGVDIVLNGGDRFIVIYDVIAASVIVTIGSLAAGAVRGARIDQHALDNSKAQATLQRERFATIINNLADAVLGVDDRGIIMVFNAAALNVLDTNQSLSGQHIDAILALYDQDNKAVSLHKELREVTASATIDSLHTMIHKEKINLEIKLSIVQDPYDRHSPSERTYIVMLRDITAQKNLERERDEFIAVVSHELRTPVAIAEGTISNALLMTERDDTTKTKLKKSITEAHTHVMFLARMINDLSTLSRAERGMSDTPEAINITEFMHSLYNQYTAQAHAKNLKLSIAVDPRCGSVFSSRLYLDELLQNFIANALKYTRSGTVSLRATRKNDHVILSVKDTGIGISKSDQKHIFERFYRAEDYRTRETSGTGLGLYIAAKLAHKIGTSIIVASRINHGSTFSISLPHHIDDTSRT
jgi:PAS domain S-box-containing protein